MHRHSERGDIITGWMVKMVVVMAIVGFIGYESLSMLSTAIALDGHAERVADAAADVLSHTRGADTREAEAAARAEAEEREVEITEFRIEDSAVIVTITKEAPTVIAHDVPGLQDWAHPSATRQSKWGP